VIQIKKLSLSDSKHNSHLVKDLSILSGLEASKGPIGLVTPAVQRSAEPVVKYAGYAAAAAGRLAAGWNAKDISGRPRKSNLLSGTGNQK
jgi:hypothetical protein